MTKSVCGHGSHVKGAVSIVQRVKKLPSVSSCKGGHLQRDPTELKGVKIKRLKYCISMTVHAEDGTEAFTVNPKTGYSLEKLEADLITTLSRKKYKVIKKEEREMSKIDFKNDPFYRDVYAALRAAAHEENGRLIVEDIRNVLSSTKELNLGQNDLDKVQGNKGLLRKVGKGHRTGKALYELTRLDTVPGADDTPAPVQPAPPISPITLEDVTEPVSPVDESPISPAIVVGKPKTDLERKAYEALWNQDEELISHLKTFGAALMQEEQELLENLARKRSQIKESTDQIVVLQNEISEIMERLDQNQ